MLNELRLIGNLTRDPELATSANGTEYCRVGIAVNTKVKESEETLFLDGTAFGWSAKNLAENAEKGSRVFLAGRLKLEDWVGKDGTKHHSYRIMIWGAVVQARRPAQAAETQDEIPF